MRNRLPSLVLSQKNALSSSNVKANGEVMMPCNDLCKWQEACVKAFKVMDKEVKLQENLDCFCSGTTAVVVIRQVLNQVIL